MKTMSLFLMMSVIGSASFAQVAEKTYVLECTVITNGNQHNWEQIGALSKEFTDSDQEAKVSIPVKSPYGDEFLVESNVDMIQLHGQTHITMDETIEINPTYSVMDTNFPDGNAPDLNGYIAKTSNLFVVKKSPKYWVSYSAGCHLSEKKAP